MSAAATSGIVFPSAASSSACVGRSMGLRGTPGAYGPPGGLPPAGGGTGAGMDYESTKHGPREDDDLKKAARSMTAGAPVESRAAPHRLEEDPGPDATISPATRPDVDQDGRLAPGELDARAELAARLAAARFPAEASQLRTGAAAAGADESLVASLAALPPGRRFDTVEQVWEALGGRGEGGR